MRRFLLPLFVFIILGVTFGSAVFLHDYQNSVTRSSFDEAAPLSSSVASIQKLPQPLRPDFPEASDVSDNSCTNLVIPQEIREKTVLLKTVIREAETRAARVHKAIVLPREIEHGDPNLRVVALTIDTGTGGNQGIEQLLAIAAHYDTPLTFFLTGCWIAENPGLTQRIIAEGHSIANHTLTHRNLVRATEEEVEWEIAETDRLTRESTGTTPVLFRKPLYAGGQRVTDLAGRLNKVSVQGFPNLGDTTGWRADTKADDVRVLVERETTPGAIWVFHNLSTADLGAFEDIVRFHLQEGYTLVRVEDLIAPPGTVL